MNKKIIVLLFALILCMVFTVPSLAVSSNNSVSYGGHSYLLIDESMTWNEADEYCKKLGGHLVSITSEKEQQFIDQLVKSHSKSKIFYWLGGNDARQEGKWEWCTGEVWSYQNWDSDQPDNRSGADGSSQNYLALDSQNSNRWNDVGNEGDSNGIWSLENIGFICEWDSLKTSFGSEVSEWSAPEIEKAYKMDLIPDVLIGQDLTQKINRAEFAAVSVKTYESLANTKALPIINNPFIDCKDLEVLKAYSVGVVNGTSATTFSPNDLLNRETAATMLTRVFKRATLDGWTLAADSSFTLPYNQPALFADDRNISGWAKDSVYFMAANKIINGVGNNKFAPKNMTTADEANGYANTTREQALTIAVRMLENLNGK